MIGFFWGINKQVRSESLLQMEHPWMEDDGEQARHGTDSYS